MSQDNDDVLVQDELTTLKARADLLSIKYHPSISVDKLREKVAAAASGEEEEEAPKQKQKVTPAVKETENERRNRLKREALALVRVRLTCMNPAKAEWEGEFITAGNGSIGSVTKFVPFVDADDGWHIPKIIYQQLAERMCQVFTTTTDSRGNKTRKGKLIREFAIEILPQLTKEELHDLAQRQAMAKSIG